MTNLRGGTRAYPPWCLLLYWRQYFHSHNLSPDNIFIASPLSPDNIFIAATFHKNHFRSLDPSASTGSPKQKKGLRNHTPSPGRIPEIPCFQAISGLFCVLLGQQYNSLDVGSPGELIHADTPDRTVAFCYKSRQVSGQRSGLA